MLISCLVFWFLAVATLRRLHRPALRRTAVALATVPMVAAFLDWRQGLHGGADLRTTAVWTRAPRGQRPGRSRAGSAPERALTVEDAGG